MTTETEKTARELLSDILAKAINAARKKGMMDAADLIQEKFYSTDGKHVASYQCDHVDAIRAAADKIGE